MKISKGKRHLQCLTVIGFLEHDLELFQKVLLSNQAYNIEISNNRELKC